MVIYRGKTSKEFFLASLLYDSIEDQDLGAVASLLEEKGADPNIVLPKKGIAPFHLAIGSHSSDFALEVTTLILRNKGNPNVRSDEGLTPVHIAAAWGRYEVLKLLLNCGGDPDPYDCSRKTPIHYAFEENYPECEELLKSYLPNMCDVPTTNDDCYNYSLTLDKIIVDNGTEIGEYEITRDCKPDSIIKNIKNTAESLQYLPETKASDYVRHWCNEHQNIDEGVYSRPLSSIGGTPEETDCDSSLNESEDGRSRPFDLKNLETIPFKKVYRKTRKVNKNSRTPSPPKRNVNILEALQLGRDSSSFENSKIETTQEFSKMSVYSKESGIVTLSESAKESENDNQVKIVPAVVKDTSSDYMTCSYNSDTNILEKNVFEVSDDLIKNQTAADEKPKDCVKLDQSAGSSGTELSFVSVSEVYKYVDEDEGVVLYEQRFLKTPTNDTRSSIKSDSFCSKLSLLPDSIDYDTDTLRRELTLQGFVPGPITKTTKQVYIKKLRQLKKLAPPVVADYVPQKKVFSFELEKTLRDPNWYIHLTDYKSLEDVVTKQFENPDPSRKWREGVNKTSFTYLLLDPRVTNNLPYRADSLKFSDVWETFLSAIFYVGKGKRNRPYAHLYEAISLWNQAKYNSENKKLQHILDIWKDNRGVVCLHIFQNSIPVEAYTREAAMIHALKVENVENIKPGDFYGIAATWPLKQKRMLGVYLLYKAMKIFLNEGERQLCPADIA